MSDPKTERQTVTITKTTTRMTVTRADVLLGLKALGIVVPDDAEIVMHGHDFPTLDDGLDISWTEEKTEYT